MKSKITWMKEEDGKVVIDASNTKDVDEEYPLKDGNVLASDRAISIFEPLDPIGGTPRTAVTFTTRVGLRGNIPTKAMNYILKKYLSSISIMMKKFDKTKEIDAYKRLQTVEEMRKLSAEGSKAFEGRFEKPEGAEKVSRETSAAKMTIKAEEERDGGRQWSL